MPGDELLQMLQRHFVPGIAGPQQLLLIHNFVPCFYGDLAARLENLRVAEQLSVLLLKHLPGSNQASTIHAATMPCSSPHCLHVAPSAQASRNIHYFISLGYSWLILRIPDTGCLLDQKCCPCGFYPRVPPSDVVTLDKDNRRFFSSTVASCQFRSLWRSRLITSKVRLCLQ